MDAQTLGAGMGIVVALLILVVFGGIVGWIASVLIKGTGLGLWKDILLGIVGATVGGWLFQILGILPGGIIGMLIAAVIGAVLVLLAIKAIRRA